MCGRASARMRACSTAVTGPAAAPFCDCCLAMAWFLPPGARNGTRRFEAGQGPAGSTYSGPPGRLNGICSHSGSRALPGLMESVVTCVKPAQVPGARRVPFPGVSGRIQALARGSAGRSPAGRRAGASWGLLMPHSIADDFKSIPMSSNLGESLERAHRFAREQTHRTVTLEHLLLALTEDQEAALILQAANVDLGRLRADVSGYLGRLLEDMRAEPGSEPRPDPELLRVLQAAASAAQQSKRRQIDGAIVLAAVVGDGKSPAAGTLKSHGMTFEEAIRALQRAN